MFFALLFTLVFSPLRFLGRSCILFLLSTQFTEGRRRRGSRGVAPGVSCGAWPGARRRILRDGGGVRTSAASKRLSRRAAALASGAHTRSGGSLCVVWKIVNRFVAQPKSARLPNKTQPSPTQSTCSRIEQQNDERGERMHCNGKLAANKQ